MQTTEEHHYQALSHTLYYSHYTTRQGILLQGANQLTLQAVSNSDWASCVDSRRSITSSLMLLDKSPISWKSKNQSVLSRSSWEAKFRAVATTSSKIVWLVHLLKELGI